MRLLDEPAEPNVAPEIGSMAYSGFKHIFVMGDHRGGQRQMKEAAEEMDKEFSPRGIRVHYVPDFYSKYQSVSLRPRARCRCPRR